MPHICQRREENPVIPGFPTEDHYRENGTCSYCGSLSGDSLMALIESGNVELVPTDKNYKVYWTSDSRTGKFYFQHLSEDQKCKFIELYNGKVIKVGFPGNFYVTPYFCKRADS